MATVATQSPCPEPSGTAKTASGPAAPEPPGDCRFDRELSARIIDRAPRLFVVVQVDEADTDEADGRIAAWGMAFADGRAEVITADGTARMSLATPERATRWLGRRTGLSARLVWLSPAAVTMPGHTETAA